MQGKEDDQQELIKGGFAQLGEAGVFRVPLVEKIFCRGERGKARTKEPRKRVSQIFPELEQASRGGDYRGEKRGLVNAGGS